ncbi:MAG: aldo/keto reductase [candidate division WOR-3 bacterium]
MIYRDFGKTGVKISQLGFGCMRFPLLDENDFKSINKPEAAKILYYAIDNGINYLDTAYGYHSGESEVFLGEVLKPEYRKKIYLATKLPVYLVKEKGDSEKYLNEQLTKLKTETIDMYLLHGLSKDSWQTVQKFDILKFLDDTLKKGKIRFAGFSFHDELPLFKEIINAYPWSFCLLHINYVDNDIQAGIKGLEYAYSKGLGVIIMEPLRGGKLARNVPEEVLNIIAHSKFKQTPAEFAFRYLYNRPEVSCVLSGMSTMEQVKQNIEFASVEHRDTLTEDELKLYEQAKKFFKSRTKINCTGCNYCSDCPQKIPISFIFEIYNDAYMYNAFDESKRMYKIFIKDERKADKCTECGQCEDRCPQKIGIINELKNAHTVLKESG